MQAPQHPDHKSLIEKFNTFVGELSRGEINQLTKHLTARTECGPTVELPVDQKLLLERDAKSQLHIAILTKFTISEWPAQDIELFISALIGKHHEHYDLRTISQLKLDEFDQVSHEFKMEFSNKLIDVIADKCPNLKTLSFGAQSEIECEQLIYFVKKVPKLNELSLNGSKLKAGQINHILKKAYPTLTALNLSNCNINKETIRILTEKFKSLESINLDQAKFEEKETSEQYTQIFHLLKELSHLKYINLGGFKFIDDKMINILSAFEDQLLHLHLTSPKITAKSISNLSRKCREITSLSLPECNLINNTTLDAIALRLKKLRKLNICSTDVTAEGLKGFINDHPKLKGAEIIINSKPIHEAVSELCESKSIELTLHKERRAPILFWSHGSIISRRGLACILNI